MFGSLASILLFFWFVAPVPTFAVNLMRQKRLHAMLLYAITVLAGFVLAVAAAWMADLHLNAELDRLDLDGDGGISGAELTPEAQQVLDDFGNDTGRVMVIFTGIPLSAIWYAICFVVLYSGKWIVGVFSKARLDDRTSIVGQSMDGSGETIEEA